jgi:hypothetical protein
LKKREGIKEHENKQLELRSTHCHTGPPLCLFCYPTHSLQLVTHITSPKAHTQHATLSATRSSTNSTQYFKHTLPSNSTHRLQRHVQAQTARNISSIHRRKHTHTAHTVAATRSSTNSTQYFKHTLPSDSTHHLQRHVQAQTARNISSIHCLPTAHTVCSAKPYTEQLPALTRADPLLPLLMPLNTYSTMQ